jgi:phage terminase large subunit-like protein
MDAKSIVKTYLGDVIGANVPANKFLRGYAEKTLPRVDAWNWDAVDRYAAFVGSVVQAAGSRAGQPLQLLPWQWTVAAQLLGDDECKALLVVVARGAGKTELAASIMAHSIITGGANQSYCAVAPTLRSASIVFDRLRVMMTAADVGAKCSQGAGLSMQGGWIRCQDSIMRALPCTETAMDGLAARLIVADEVARMEKGFTRVVTGLGKDTASKLLAITTPDAKQRIQPVYPYWEALSRHYCGGEVARPDGWQGMFYGLDADDNALDESTWIKAQPSLGHTVDIGQMRNQVISMMGTHDPHTVAECDMQILCRHNDRLSGGLDLSILERQMAEPIDWNALRGAPAVMAVDMAKGAQIGLHSNLASLALCVYDAENRRYCYRMVHWYAGGNIEADERRCRQPLRRWIAEGALRRMAGEIHDLSVIEAAILEFSSRYAVRHVGVDPLSHQESAIADWRKRGIVVTGVDQSIRTMGPGWALWTDGLRGKTIVHERDEVLRACLAATKTIQDNAGNIRPVKGRSDGNIDAVVASCMAAFLAERFQVSQRSGYEGGKIVI